MPVKNVLNRSRRKMIVSCHRAESLSRIPKILQDVHDCYIGDFFFFEHKGVAFVICLAAYRAFVSARSIMNQAIVVSKSFVRDHLVDVIGNLWFFMVAAGAFAIVRLKGDVNDHGSILNELRRDGLNVTLVQPEELDSCVFCRMVRNILILGHLGPPYGLRILETAIILLTH